MSSLQPAITVAEEVTSPETARSRRRSESSCATTAGRLDTWHGTAITPMSRSATPVAALDTFRSAVRRSNATGELPVRDVTAPEYTRIPSSCHFLSLSKLTCCVCVCVRSIYQTDAADITNTNGNI